MTDSAGAMIESTQQDDVVVVRITRTMLTDEDNLELLGQSIQDVVNSTGEKKLILDVSELKHVTSAVLGKWIYLHRSIHRDGGRMIVCGAGPELEEIFTATRLSTLFELADSLETAQSLMDAA